MDVNRARTKDPIEWLETCPEFSWPLANQVREWFLTWEPDLNEAIKWNMLCFSGHKLVVGMSACKHHLGLSFFRGTELDDPAKLFVEGGENNTNIRSLRLTSLDDITRNGLRELLHGAVELDAELALPPLPKKKRRPFPMPDYFAAALKQKKNRVAAENFQKLAPSCQREYIVWLTFAKRSETRARRLKETLAALSKGKKWALRKSV
jgi:uncharacterized protein YdeI (YjbR/CyaY-like superfamily)